MSHDLEILKNGEASFAFTGEDPWHGLGTRVAGNLTPEEIMKAASLDWEVGVLDMEVVLPNGERVIDEESAKLVRLSDNRLFSTVTPGWEPVQNRTAFEFYDEWVRLGQMTMETAGALDEGRKVFALARVGEEFEITKGDKVKPYMLFTNNHKYGAATDVRLVCERVVCKNTLAIAFSEVAQNKFSMSHATVFNADRAKAGLGFVADTLRDYQQTMQDLTQATYSDDQLLEFAQEIFPASEKKRKDGKLSRNAEDFLAIIDKQPGVEYAEGTFYNLVQGVTYMASHGLGRTEEGRLVNAWYGTTQKLSTQAVRLAQKMKAA